MSTRSGQILTFAGQTNVASLVDRAQSAGPGTINRNKTPIKELGNELTISNVYDTPDLGFDLNSLDMTTEIEAFLTRVDPSSVTPGQEFKFTSAKPLNIVSPYKGSYGTFVTVRGVAIPYLVLESASYKFAVGQNADETFSLRGDSIYYAQSTPYGQRFNGTGTTGTYAFAHTAIKTVEQGDDVFAYCVTVHYADGTWKRLFHGDDYTDSSAGFALVVGADAPVGSTVDCVYASATALSVPQSIHPTSSQKPPAVRHRDVDIKLGDGAATPSYVLWKGVQSAQMDWKVTLDPTEELGNPHYVERDYDTPDVSGQIVMRGVNPQALFDQIARVAGVTAVTGGETINTLSSAILEVEMIVHDPDTGAVLKTLYCPDARFEMPAVKGQVGQKQDVTFTFASESGDMSVFAGA